MIFICRWQSCTVHQRRPWSLCAGECGSSRQHKMMKSFNLHTSRSGIKINGIHPLDDAVSWCPSVNQVHVCVTKLPTKFFMHIASARAWYESRSKRDSCGKVVEIFVIIVHDFLCVFISITRLRTFFKTWIQNTFTSVFVYVLYNWCFHYSIFCLKYSVNELFKTVCEFFIKRSVKLKFEFFLLM